MARCAWVVPCACFSGASKRAAAGGEATRSSAGRPSRRPWIVSAEFAHYLHRCGQVLLAVDLRRLELAVAEDRLHYVQPVRPQLCRPAVSQTVRVPSVRPPPGPHLLLLLRREASPP